MKLSKTELKSIIKECLIEILADGLGSNLTETINHGQVRKHVTTARPVNRSPRETIRYQSAIKEAVESSAGGNPVLANILADTAATTLQAQINADRHGPSGIVAADAVSLAVAESTPEELFGDEAASKWASLAFDT